MYFVSNYGKWWIWKHKKILRLFHGKNTGMTFIKTFSYCYQDKDLGLMRCRFWTTEVDPWPSIYFSNLHQTISDTSTWNSNWNFQFTLQIRDNRNNNVQDSTLYFDVCRYLPPLFLKIIDCNMYRNWQPVQKIVHNRLTRVMHFFYNSRILHTRMKHHIFQGQGFIFTTTKYYFIYFLRKHIVI